MAYQLKALGTNGATFSCTRGTNCPLSHDTLKSLTKANAAQVIENSMFSKPNKAIVLAAIKLMPRTCFKV